MELKLLKPLTKGGIQLPVGAVIDVPEQKVEWFISTGTASRLLIVTDAAAPDEDNSSTRSSRSRKSRGRKNRS